MARSVVLHAVNSHTAQELCMDTISLPRSLAEELMIALNHMRNQPSGGQRWRTTYELAVELSRVLKASQGVQS
ncbi:MAG TPA: hypothetical protein PKC83_08475 [Gemmatimonadaceae bacterium]|jgi:hypothetical protein|nr:hypothetical protein [Gemmatimonadaceae bacterium]